MDTKVTAAYFKYSAMTIVQLLKELGYNPSEVNRHTYLYITNDGELCGSEMRRGGARMIDEAARLYWLLRVDSIAAIQAELR